MSQTHTPKSRRKPRVYKRLSLTGYGWLVADALGVK